MQMSRLEESLIVVEFSVPFQVNFLYNLFIYFITFLGEGEKGWWRPNFPR